MRNGTLTARIVVGCVAALAVGALGAGCKLTVVKNVVGPVPEGTQFVVTLACEGFEGEDIIVDPDGGGEVPSFDFVFEADGTPLGPDTVEFSMWGTCTVTETETGSADSVVYECADNRDDFELDEDVVFCTSTGPQTEPMEVALWVSGEEVLVTVTNTFDELDEVDEVDEADEVADEDEVLGGGEEADDPGEASPPKALSVTPTYTG